MVTVFLVEDNEASYILYEKLLIMKGYEVIGIANNGVEAVELYKSAQKRPDVILMDHRMPLKNGIEVMKEIYQIDENAKIIFVSVDIRSIIILRKYKVMWQDCPKNLIKF